MFLFTCFISFFLRSLYKCKWSQIDFNFRREGGRFKILIIEIICIGVLNVIYCSALSSMSPPASSMAAAAWFWPWEPCGWWWQQPGEQQAKWWWGTGVNTAGAGGGAGGGSGGAPASAGGGGGSSAAASAGGGGGAVLLLLLLAVGAALLLLLIVVKSLSFCQKVFTSDKEAFLCIRLRMTPDWSQRTIHNSWVTMHALHVK